MLNPEQIGRLRQMLSAGEQPEIFDGYHLASEPVSVIQEQAASDVLFKTLPTSGDFYKPERVFGTPINSSCLDGIGAWMVDCPARQIVRIPDAKILGNTAVINAAGTLYSPECVSTRDCLVHALGVNATDHQGFVLQFREHAAVATFVSAERVHKLPINALFLHNLEPGNYGSFLLRQLLQMQVPAELFSAYDCYVVPERTPWFAEACALLRLPDRPVYTVREVSGQIFNSILLWSHGDTEGFIASELREGVICALIGHEQSDGPKNIFVSRALSSVWRPDYRRLLNENLFEEAVQRYGYTIVHPETLRLATQIKIFSGAKKIIGLSGSGMINCMFAKQDTRILDVESFTTNVRQHAKLYASGKTSYGFAFGTLGPENSQPVSFRNWYLPLDVMGEALEWMA